MAATTDGDIVAQLTQSIMHFLEMNTALTTHLKSVMETNNKLIKKIGNNKATSLHQTISTQNVAYVDAVTPA